MAQNYTRQSTFSDGDTITSSLFNDEYNQLVNVFTYSSTSTSTTGHRHDGTAGQGGNIFKIGDLDFLNKIEVDSTNNRWGFYVEVSSAAVEQIRIQDGSVVPVTTNDIDLGTSSLQFKDLYIDGTANVDSLTLTSGSTVTTILDEDDLSSDSATALVTQQSVKAYVDAQVTAQDLDFQADSGGALSIDLDSEALTFTGGTGVDTSGSSNAVTFAIDSTVATLTGTQTLTNKTLTSPDVNTPDIDGGTIDGTVIGGSTAAAGSFTTVSATGNITVDGTVDGRDVATDGTKLDGIEASATADQTDAEIRAAVEAATDSNVFTDADHTKLNAIEASADVTDTANVTAAGALMDSELTSIASVKALNQGVATTDSPTFAGLTTTADVSFGDNDKALFGAGSDLQIYHDGSNSYIKDAGTGYLVLGGQDTGVTVQNGSGQNLILTGANAVTLSYGSASKLATTSTGIDVTGTATMDGLTVDGQGTFTTSDNNAQVTLVSTDTDALVGPQLNLWRNSGTGTNGDLIGQITFTGEDTVGSTNTFASIYSVADQTNNGSEDGSIHFQTLINGVLADRLEINSAGNTVVTGTVTADGLTVDGDGSFTGNFEISGLSPKIFLSETDTTDLNTRLRNAAGKLQIQTVDNSDANPVTRFQINHSTGDISFYEDTGTTAKLTWDASAETLNFADNGKAIFGTGSDMSLFHNGNNGFLDNDTGTLFIQTDSFSVKNATGTESLMLGTADGAVTLYHNNLAKLATTSTGIDITGIADASTLFRFGTDNSEIANNYLRFKSSGTGFFDHNTVGQAFNFRVSASSALDTTPLVVNSTGIDVTGTVTAGDSSANADLILTEGSTNTDARIRNSNGILEIDADLNNEFGNSSMMFAVDGVDKLKINNNGDISFYEDTGTTAKFFWDSSAEALGIGTSSPSATLALDKNTTTQHRVLDLENNSITYSMYVDQDNSSTNSWSLFDTTNSQTALRYLPSSSGYWQFYTNNTERMRIDSSGNVGINTSPSTFTGFTNLTIKGGSNGANLDFFNNSGTRKGAIVLDSVNSLIAESTEQLVFKTGSSLAERMRIDSSGNVGIGTDSPAGNLHISGSGDRSLLITGGTAGTTSVQMGDSSDADAGAIRYDNSNNSMQFTTAGTEAMRIDSSQNLLVSKSSLDVGEVGLELRADGLLAATRSGSNVAVFRRLSDNGSIVDFQKDGTTVGSIGCDSNSNFMLGQGDTGLSFQPSSDRIIPRNTDGSGRDAAIDLGGTGNRFKDLYLSGDVIAPNIVASNGVFLGGTSNANKLDDYEEGTWVATAVSGCTGLSSSTTNNRYTKIGNVVHVIGEISSFTGTDSSNLEIGGLPFSVGNGMESSFSVLYTNVNLDSGYTQVVGYAFPNASKFRIYEVGDNVAYNTIRGDQISSGSFIFQMTYHT